jgi:hypothetical protein
MGSLAVTFAPEPDLAVSSRARERGLEAHAPRPAAPVELEAVARGHAPVLRRACACGGTPGPDGECAACRARRLGLERSREGAGPAYAPPVVHRALQAPGRPLDSATRASFEARLGHDLGAVRVHTGALAGESARAIDADAYTVGSHVVLRSGYGPESPEGSRLLAHELTHVVQQRAAGYSPGEPVPVGAPDAAAEREASRFASGAPTVPTATGPVLRRVNGAGTTRTTASTFGDVCDPTNDPCLMARCTAGNVTTARGDLRRALSYVDQAVAAVSTFPLASTVARALDWYFNDSRQATAREVARRLGCIRECLDDTLTTSRFGCHPDYWHPAYVCVPSTPICTHALANVCLSDLHFGTSDRERAETMIHECAHRVGMSLGSSDVRGGEARFRFLDTDEALQTSDSFALFASGITEGVPRTWVPTVGLTAGAAISGRGAGPWFGRLYFGAEVQHPVVGIFNPTLEIGIGLLGAPEAEPGTPEPPSSTLLLSVLGGIRIGDPRPGPAGGPYLSLFGGPSLAGGESIGAEAGVGVGYRWKVLDLSAGVGYTYDPTRDDDRHFFTVGSTLTFVLPEF